MVKMNENELNNLFNQAKSESVHTSFEETKNHFEKSIHSVADLGKKKKIINLKNGIMITLISAIVVATIIQVNQPQEVVENEVSQTNSIKEKGINKREKEFISEGDFSEEKENLRIDKETPSTVESTESITVNELYLKNETIEQEEGSKVENESEIIFRFPLLTEKEEVENQKRKRKMMKDLVKFNKKEYVFISSGSLKTENESKSIQSFYVQVAEVTNIQYRTFLTDLVQKGEKEKYRIASPKTDVWPKEAQESQENPMDKLYFSHPAYDDYPVVGISQKGAELYCEWLSEEVVSYSPSRKYDDTWIKVRIPSVTEWMYVANEGGGEIKHRWSSEGLQNEKGCYLANFNQEISDDGAVLTAKTKTYYPNYFGVYNIFGNVAELVYYSDENKVMGTKGGGWQSDINDLDIDYNDPNKGNIQPSSNIGFRVVISFVKR